MLQWLFAESWSLISQLVYAQSLHNHSSHCFHIGNVNSSSDPHTCVAHSVTVMLQWCLPDGGLWFFDWFTLIISTTTCSIAIMLELQTHLRDCQAWLAYQYVPMISRQMPASYFLLVDCFMLIIFTTSHCFAFILELWTQWVSQSISVPLCSSDFCQMAAFGQFIYTHHLHNLNHRSVIDLGPSYWLHT